MFWIKTKKQTNKKPKTSRAVKEVKLLICTVWWAAWLLAPDWLWLTGWVSAVATSAVTMWTCAWCKICSVMWPACSGRCVQVNSGDSLVGHCWDPELLQCGRTRSRTRDVTQSHHWVIWVSLNLGSFDTEEMNHLLFICVQVSVTGEAAKDVAVKFAFLCGKGIVYVQLDVLLNWELVMSSCFTGTVTQGNLLTLLVKGKPTAWTWNYVPHWFQ